MEYIKKKELKDGDVFVAQLSHNHFLNKYGTGYSLNLNTDNIIKSKILRKGAGFSYDNMRLATPEEKHWLNKCIKLNKFIEFEEAMKTFIPEYVECVKVDGKMILNNIYKIKSSKEWGVPDNNGCNIVIYVEPIAVDGPFYLSYFKPSTKEAYDAQFVVKEPEFVLPKKWYIVRNLNNYKIINNYFANKFPYLLPPSHNSNSIGSTEISWTSRVNDYTEITFEQFKKYVLKEETIVEEVKVIEPIIKNKTEMEIWLENTKSLNLSLIGLIHYIGSDKTCNFTNIFTKLEGRYSEDKAKILFSKWNNQTIEPLPQFKIIETIETITKVENNEGNQFFIGDVVKSSNGTVQTIKSFDYNKAKTNIIAFTNKQPKLGNGIGIDKIEHYIEPKVEVEKTLLEKAKRLYPVGTKIKTACFNTVGIIKNDIFYETDHHFGKKVIYVNNGALSIYDSEINKWAEIIE